MVSGKNTEKRGFLSDLPQWVTPVFKLWFVVSLGQPLSLAEA